jgi:Flp pilus assembly protein TadG
MTVLAVPVMILLAMFVVFCGRATSAAIDVHTATAAAARAAAHATTPAAATLAATDTLAANTTATGWTCTAATDTTRHHRGGHVTVTITCTVPLADLGLPINATRTVTATATEPIDTFRANSLGFANTDVSSATARGGGGL